MPNEAKTAISKAASVMGKKGGAVTFKRYGKAHFSNAGKKGMKTWWKGHKKPLLPKD